MKNATPQTALTLANIRNMPDAEVIFSYNRIRAMERDDAKKIPIIAMTANAFTEDVEKSKNAGMNDHLAKPLDIRKMLSTISKYMSN